MSLRCSASGRYAGTVAGCGGEAEVRLSFRSPGTPHVGQYWKNAFLRVSQAGHLSNSFMPQWTQKFDGEPAPPTIVRSHPGHMFALIFRSAFS